MKKLGMLFIFLFSFLYTYSQSSQRDVVSEKARHDSIKPYRTSRVIIDGCQIGDTLWFPDGTYQVTAAAFDTSLSWLDPVISFADYTTKTCATVADSGQAYIYPTIGVKYQHIFTCDGSGWNEYTPSLGDAVTVIDSGKVFVFDGTIWIASSSSSSSYWAASGTNILNTNSGSVLIGTTTITPGYKFRVNGASQMGLVSGSAFYVGTNQTLGSNSYFNLTAGATFGGTGYIKFNTNDGGASPTERVRLTSDGTLETYHNLRAGNGNDTLFVNNVFVFGGDTMTSIVSDNSHTDALFNVTTGSGIGGSFTTAANNVFNGYQAGYRGTTSLNNVAIGYRALYGNQTGHNNTVIGHSAAYGNGTGSMTGVTIIGIEAGYNNTGNYNMMLGYQAGYSNTIAIDNTYIGFKTGYYVTGSSNVFIGTNTAENYTSASNNTVIGSGANSQGGGGLSNNTIIGTSAGRVNSANSNTIIGFYAGYTSTSGAENVFIGSEAARSNTTAGFNVVIGQQANYYNQEGGNSVVIGHYAAKGTSLHNKSYITAVGEQSLLVCHGSNNDALGYKSGQKLTSGTYNLLLGNWAGGELTSGNYNVALAFGSNYYNQTGSSNVAIGYNACNGNSVLHNKSNVTAVGYNSLFSCQGSNNTAYGYQSGYSVTTGTGNLFLGYQAGYNETGSNKLYIDNSNTATPLIHGDFSTDDVTVNGDLHVRSIDAFYFGDETTDGTWRIIRDGNNLVFERRESGSWVTKSSMTP